MNQQGEVGGLSEVGNATSFFDGGSGKLGLHELHIGSIMGGLLGGICVVDGGRGRAILGIVYGRSVARFGGSARWGAVIALSSVAGVPCQQ